MRLAVLGALVALAVAGSEVRDSRAAFTSSAKNPSNTFSTAADWVAPAVTLAAPADGSFTNDTTPTFSGAAGNATGDATTVTVRIYSGTTVAGPLVQTLNATRSGATWTVTPTTALAAGATYTARAAQSDTGANTGSSTTSTFTVDTIAPTPAMISAANSTAGNPGRLNAGDTITYRFSEAIAPASVLSTFTGGSTTANVRVRFTNAGTGGAADTFTVLDSAGAANVKLDTSVATNANLVTSTTVTWPATMTQSSDGTTFTIVLGTAPSGLASVTNTAKNMVWTAKAGPTDRAGNALSISGTIAETDSDVDF
jgi:hypothetical protein